MRAKGFSCGILAVALVAGGCRKKDRDLTTDLHRAADRGDASQVQTLIAHGASVSARDERGRTPLHLAAADGHRDVVEILIRCGARIDCEDECGLTPVASAAQRDRRAVVKCLVQEGAAVGLHLMAYLGDAEGVRRLIQEGANVDAAESGGWTPLHYAAKHGCKAIAEMLVGAGANV
ncbi:MAG: hypothetical protein FJ280_16270, partial [Planctomycetes bacterium]|nr:hypothetical protein [Planctomycetota bacterium]